MYRGIKRTINRFWARLTFKNFRKTLVVALVALGGLLAVVIVISIIQLSTFYKFRKQVAAQEVSKRATLNKIGDIETKLDNQSAQIDRILEILTNA